MKTSKNTLNKASPNAGRAVIWPVGPSGLAVIVLITLLNARDLALAQPEPIPAPPGIVAWWPGDGDGRDIVGTNNGLLQSGATFTTGMVGQAFSFDGSGAQVVATSVGLPTGASDRTIELWVRVDSFLPAPDFAFLAGYGAFGNTQSSFELGGYSDGTLWWSSWGPSFAGPQLQTGMWYHVAVTSQGGAVNIYLNGTQVASGALPFFTPPGGTFYLGAIGSWSGVNERLQGALDEISVYDRALADDEILAIYQAGSAGKIRSGPELHIGSSGHLILLWWPIDASGFLLESSPRLGAAQNWTSVPGPIYVFGDQNVVAVDASVGSKYFRLRKQ